MTAPVLDYEDTVAPNYSVLSTNVGAYFEVKSDVI